MKKYQIKEIKEIYNHAGSKAVEDVFSFAKELEYTPLYICQRAEDTGFVRLVQNQLGFLTDWIKAFFSIEKNSVLLLQNPFKRKHLGRFLILNFIKKVKKCTIISLIHDVEELRLAYYRNFSTTEFQFMKKNSDYFIVHNDIMKDYFISRGFREESLVSLEIFDYAKKESKNDSKVRKADVVIAGNLEKQKSPYVYALKNLGNKIKVNLYGPNFEEDITDDYINYEGSFPSDEIPNIIDGKFGLVWDGSEINNCGGETGNYLRYNNPHKTSLYLVSNLPVIIWNKAAMAKFIEKENLGLTIASIEEIKDKVEALSSEDYNRILENTKKISERLSTGYYLKKALSECENRMQNQ